MKYFAMMKGERVGPLDLEELVNRGLLPTDYVWCKGMPDWKQALEVADICRFFRRRLHDNMHPTPAADAQVEELQQPSEQEPQKYRDVWRDVLSRPVHADHSGEPPVACPQWLMVLGILMFFPLGIPAWMAHRKMARNWREKNADEARDCARRAVMLSGMAVCIGMVLIAALLMAF